MSIATVITGGFGSFGGISFVIRDGYDRAAGAAGGVPGESFSVAAFSENSFSRNSFSFDLHITDMHVALPPFGDAVNFDSVYVPAEGGRRQILNERTTNRQSRMIPRRRH